MSETRLILGLARREARERARSRAFQVSTAILLLAAVAAVVLPTVLGAGETDPYQVGVVGAAPAGLTDALAASAPDDRAVQVVTFADRSTGEDALRGDEPLNVLLDDRTLVWDGEPDAQLEATVSSGLTQLAIARRAAEAGLDPGQAQEILAPVDVTSVSLDAPEGEADTDDRGPQALIATAGMVLLFVSITFYGSYILMSVIEEKQNRVVEVLLAHVRPRDLLAGKVLGHGALGLAQFLAIAIIAAVGLALTDTIEVPTGAYGAIAHTVLWFVLGYSFYSILYGALGSLASRNEDAQSAVGPLTVLLLAAYFAAFTTINAPDGWLAVVGSFLPPTAPLMMPIRAALSDVAAWEILAAVALELAAIVGLVRLGGRLYRGAVLRVGRKLSLREAWEATS